MRVPAWLTLGIAAIVMIFGGYRLWLATRAPAAPPEGATHRRGLYGMSRKAHLVIGLLYVLLGGALIATSLGFNPFAGAIGPDTTTPSKSEAPAGSKTIPIDQLPKP